MLDRLLPWRKRIAELEALNVESVGLTAEAIQIINQFRQDAADRAADAQEAELERAAAELAVDLARENAVTESCSLIGRVFDARFNTLTLLDGVGVDEAACRMVTDDPLLWSAVVLSARVRSDPAGHRSRLADALLILTELVEMPDPVGVAVDELLGGDVDS